MKIIFILNVHMPFVLLDENKFFDERENWIFEAITETYVPLFNVLAKWKGSENVKVITSFTPSVLKQIRDAGSKYSKYLDQLDNTVDFVQDKLRTGKIDDILKNKVDLDTSNIQSIGDLNEYYKQRIAATRKLFTETDPIDFINSIKNIEKWTSTPNHNFLPFFERETQDYLIRRGIQEFQELFHSFPEGFWLPECAYYPGMEELFTGNKIPSIALNINTLGNKGKEKSGIYNYKGLNIYVHDHRICIGLWKTDKTIPSNPEYREFYRDIGWDMKTETMSNLGFDTNDDNKGIWTGLRYHRITGTDVGLSGKEIYDIHAARKKIKLDAKLFIEDLKKKIFLTNDHETVVLAFDAEFFGHWWFEGVWFLEEVLNYEF